MGDQAAEADSSPRVTVVVCAYRQVAHLEVALASALAQTYRAFTVLVADDSASPDIEALCARLADPRIVYIPREPSLGIAANHWDAFARSTTSYIAVLNHDDVWEPGFLEAAVASLEADPSINLAFCDHWIIDETGAVLEPESMENSRYYGRSRLAPGRHPDGLDLVMRNTVPLAMGSLFRRSALDLARFDPKVGGAYDLWTAYILGRETGAFYYIPDRLTRYRVHRESATAKLHQTNLEGALNIVDAQLADDRCARYRRALQTRKASLLRSLAGDKRAKGLYSEARRDLVASLAARASLRSALKLLAPPYR